MNEKVNLDINMFHFLYQKYKDFVLPLGIIAASFVLFFFVVIPQVQNYIQLQQQVAQETQKLNAIKSNYDILSGLDDNTLSTQLNTVSLALPFSKDFASVLNAISAVSAKTGVLLGDFDFRVGDLSKSGQGIKSYPSLVIDLKLNTDIKGAVKFIDELYKTVPVSETTDIKLSSGGSSEINISFYYKPLVGKSSIDQSNPITLLSQGDKDMISSLSSWNNMSGEGSFPLLNLNAISSQSAVTSSGSGTTPF